jgi:DNA-binding HxlR family transcriptional regulator
MLAILTSSALRSVCFQIKSDNFRNASQYGGALPGLRPAFPRGMAMTKRAYDQYCPVAGALDIVGERWAMLVVRELLSGPKRFVDLEAGLPGIGTNTLATRMSELEAAGVVEKRRLGAPSSATVYALTAWGAGLEPVVHAIARWGAARLGSAHYTHPLRASWLAIALQAFYRRGAVKPLTADIELVLPTGTLMLRFRRGALRVTEAAAEAPALRVVTTEENLLALLSGPNPRARRSLDLAGDAALVDHLIAAFPLKEAPAS